MREPGKFISRIDRRKFNFIERTSLVIGEFHFDFDLKAGRKERSIIIKFAYLIGHERLCEVAFSSKTLSIFSLSMKWNDKRRRFEVHNDVWWKWLEIQRLTFFGLPIKLTSINDQIKSDNVIRYVIIALISRMKRCSLMSMNSMFFFYFLFASNWDEI